MKKIPLTQGKFAIVDDEDFEWLNQWKWCAIWDGWNWYVIRGKHPQIKMHRLILDLEPGDKKHTDHTNGNGLDNRRQNIRICTRSQNLANQKIQMRIKTSKYKGVSWHKKAKKWRAYIRINNKRIYLGLFNFEISAAKTYNKAARKYFGKFARTNYLSTRSRSSYFNLDSLLAVSTNCPRT